MAKQSVLTFLFLWFTICTVKAQKENNIWVSGTGCGLNFNSGAPVAFLRNDQNDIWRTDASICDKNDNLLFYTNGYRAFNRDFQIMQNGDALNIGDYVSFGYNELATADAAAIIPVPEDSDKYYIFHADLNYTSWDTFTNILMPTHLFYDVVDMSLDGGLGGIVTGQKDIVILSDTLTECGFKIVKHGNGRDYWLICHELNSSRYYRFLIDPNGIHGPFSQDIGVPLINYDAIGFSTMAFTKNATMAAQLHNDLTAVELFNFDRCTGEFYNPVYFSVSDTGYYLLGGNFSVSGRYLYVSANWWNYIFQFDVTDSDIVSSKKLIAVYDGNENPSPSNFYQMCLGPDNKLYVNAYGANNAIHVINYPDSAGIACKFVENAVTVSPPGTDWRGFPNTVNYSLGPLAGSGCDSLDTVTQLPAPDFTWGVYPNPFAEQLNVGISGAKTNAEIAVYNLVGQQVFYTKQQPNDYFVYSSISLSSLPAGMYVVTVQVNGKQYERKVIKQ